MGSEGRNYGTQVACHGFWELRSRWRCSNKDDGKAIVRHGFYASKHQQHAFTKNLESSLRIRKIRRRNLYSSVAFLRRCLSLVAFLSSLHQQLLASASDDNHDDLTASGGGQYEAYYSNHSFADEFTNFDKDEEQLKSPELDENSEEKHQEENDNLEELSSGNKRSTLNFKEENGILVLESLKSFPRALRLQRLSSTEKGPHGLLLALLYSSAGSCSSDQHGWISRFESAASNINHMFPQQPIIFGKLDVTSWNDASKILSSIGVTNVPVLVFAVARNLVSQEEDQDKTDRQVYLLDYLGPLDTPEDISSTVLHYYYRLFLVSTNNPTSALENDIPNPPRIRPFPGLQDDFAKQVIPKVFDNIQSMQEFWSEHWTRLQRIAQGVQDRPGGVSRKYEDGDYKFIRSLLNEKSIEDKQQVIQLFVQCQAKSDVYRDAAASTNSEELMTLFTTYSELAWILSSRRNVYHLGVAQCPPEMEVGRVWKFEFPLRLGVNDLEWVIVATNPTFEHYGEEKRDLVLRQFLVQQATPAVLWWDRRATIPIAFAGYYQVHYLLFVSLHDIEHEVSRDSRELRKIVGEFHRVCRDLRQNTEVNAICLIVPSTETRVLTTFGIDFWSRLDREATEESVKESSQMFPTLLITDSREQKHEFRDGSTSTSLGVERYFLRPPQIFEKHAVAQFCESFWIKALTPELISSPPLQEKVNSYGVTTLNGWEFQQCFQTRSGNTNHSVVLFTSHSCGHCKRFHYVWNKLSNLLHQVHWNKYISLYKLDVSQNEVLNMALPWLPDVYYFPPVLEKEQDQNLPVKPIRYDRIDEFNNGVGRVSDPLEILDWLLDVMVGDWIDPDLLLSSLGGLETTSDVTEGK